MYSCCARMDPDSLACSESLLDDYLPEDVTLEDREAHPDFFTLAFLGTNIPKLRARYTKLCMAWSGGHVSIRKAHALLQDAKDEDEKAAHWPHQRPHRMPYMSHPLPLSGKKSPSEVYPSRIDKYHHGTHATVCNGWRLARVGFLAIIAQTAGFLASTTTSLSDAKQLWDTRDQAEKMIRELVDDFCASIPYIISPDNTDEMLLYYPHAPGDVSFHHVSESDLISSMSQLLPSLIVGSQVYCIPHSQKQWLQQYMTMLSRNPKEDTEKAMRLAMVDGLDTSGRMIVPPSPKAGSLVVEIVNRR